MLEHKTAEMGGLRVQILGEPGDEARSWDHPAILLCHGFGAPGNDLVSLAEYIKAPKGTRWFFPEAPIDLRSDGIPGRAWWRIDIMRMQMMAMSGRTRQLTEETPAGLPEARAQLESCIAEIIASQGVKRDQLIIGGFSQGAMITTDLALASPNPFAGLVIMSGTMLSEATWAAQAAKVGPHLHVLMSHGRADPLLPFPIAESLREMLVSSGADVEWVPHAGQHEIPPEVLARFSDFARRAFEKPAAS